MTSEQLWRLALALFAWVVCIHSCHAVHALQRISVAVERCK